MNHATRFTKLALLLIVVGALALLAGCGGDDGLSAADQARIDDAEARAAEEERLRLEAEAAAAEAERQGRSRAPGRDGKAGPHSGCRNGHRHGRDRGRRPSGL